MNRNEQHRLVILGSLSEFIPLVKRAKERGIYTIVCDGYSDGPAKQFADVVYNIDVRNHEEIAKMCVAEKADGIIGSFSDLLFEQITKIADIAGLRWYAKTDMLDYYREKDCAKALLTKLGVRVPKNTQLYPDFNDAELDGFVFPLVIKPVNGYGSKGIFVVRTLEEIRDYFDQVVLRSSGVRQKIQVEEYAQGYEYNIMTWLTDGKVYPLGLADRERNPQVGSAIPQMNRIAYPSRNLDKIIDEATLVLQKFADAVGQTEGALSMQFFYDENGVEVCEIAGRLFAYENELITYGSGLSIMDLLLDYVYDPEKVRDVLMNHSTRYEKCFAGFYFVGIHGKTIADQSVIRELAKDPHVMDTLMFYEDGETIDRYSSKSYLVRYYIGAESREELDAVTKMFFERMYVPATDGERLDMPFIFETRG